uniref:dnaJ homolog subfamily C member 9-like isoform X2 n=1 Tax=Myxine glutinosa TaxID=7769 RepID=UPI00358FE42D
MPVSCVAVNCCNRSNRENIDKKRFFRFPAVIYNSDDKTRHLSQKRRRLWFAAVKRKDIAYKDSQYMRVCSDHFVGGSPSALYQDNYPDWVPSLKLGYGKGVNVDKDARLLRLQGRNEAARLRVMQIDLQDEDQVEMETETDPGYIVSATPLLDSCAQYFGTRDLYIVLSIGRDASDADLQRAYRRQALLLHPDRAEAAFRQPATASFQVLSKAHAILSNNEQRALYDEQGIVNERCDAIQQVKNWDQYFKHLFKKVNVVNIRSFEEVYRGSEEERDDLRQAYFDFQGDMDRIMEVMLCARVEDELVFRKLLEVSVRAGELPDYSAFSNRNKLKQALHNGKIKCAKDFENFEYQVIIKFFINEGIDTQAIYERLFAVSGERCPDYSTVEKWALDCKRRYKLVEEDQETCS